MRKLLVLALLLLSSTAHAANRVWIAEFVAIRVEAAPIATLPALARQTPLDLTGGAAKTSAVFNMQTKYIRIVCEMQCAVTASGVATASDILLPPLRPEYFAVEGGKTISAILAP